MIFAAIIITRKIGTSLETVIICVVIMAEEDEKKEHFSVLNSCYARKI